MRKPSDILDWIKRQPRWRWMTAAAVLTLAILLVWLGRGTSGSKAPTFAARRGPLEINVLVGGSLQALESQEIKCEVRVGYQGTKILKIVDEGYFVTEEDVKTNKVLVELDGSDLQKQIVQQEIQFQSAVASLTDAEQGYEIQVGQNQSDVQAAEQKARFARLDLDKFLGDSVTAQIVKQVGLDDLLAAAMTNDVQETALAEEVTAQPSGKPNMPPGVAMDAKAAAQAFNQALQPAVAGTASTNSQNILAGGQTPIALKGAARAGDAKAPATLAVPAAKLVDGIAISSPVPANLVTNSPPPALTPAGAAGQQTSAQNPAPASRRPEPAASDMPKSIAIDFSKYANLDALGDGEAKQKLRKFDDDLQVAQKELGQAQATLEGTRRLSEKGFVTKIDLQRDEIAFDNSRLKVVTAETARDLFLKYDFLKSAEEALSKFNEAVHEFDKARRVAVSRLAQAKAKLKSAQGQYQVQSRQLKDFNEQLAKCTLRAQKSGLVVYGGSRDDMVFYGGEERIREGATVRERQAIITIPDMSRMSVNVKIHESYIKKIKKGQKARITVDAFPDTVLTGEVTKVGVLPDSANRWMNPDMKVYLTTITIDGTYDWVKPGMSAKVEILVNKLDNCVYVPVQAVTPDNGKQICYIARGMQPERRELEIGEFNDEFIEVKHGLREGERVLLRAPGSSEPSAPSGTTEEKKAPAQQKKSAPAPSSLPATASKA